jgi:hypothetical protein
MLIFVLHAILMWQQAQANTPVAGYCPKIDALCFVTGPPQQAQDDKAVNEDWYNPHHHSTAIYLEKEIAPFDVPAESWVEHYVLTKLPANADYLDGLRSACFTRCLEENGNFVELIPHHTCKKKSRFLLMSEDGKWHCLALNR